jgi:hypothetical protein
MPLQQGTIDVLAQAVSDRSFNAEASFRSQANPCGIFEGECSNEVEASTTTSVFPCSYQSTIFRPIIETT